MAVGSLLVVVGCGGAAAAPEARSSVEPARVALALRFEEGPTDAQSDTPTTHVRLALIRAHGATTVHDLGLVAGACDHQDVRHPTLISALCWWAGAGTQFDVAADEDSVDVTVTELDESAATPVARRQRSFPIPEGATLHPIRPDSMPRAH